MKNPQTTPTNAQLLIQYNKIDTKARRIILEGINEYIIPHLHGKRTENDMWTTILALYQGFNDAKKLALKNRPRSIQMSKGEPIITCLYKLTQVRDERAGVGKTIADKDLVSLALLGLHKSWENFQDAVSGRENLPN